MLKAAFLTAAALVVCWAYTLSGAGAQSALAADKDCSDFATQAQAQHYFDAKGGSPSNNVDLLDGDHDGKSCEDLPCPCASPGSSNDGGSGGGGGEKAERVKARVIETVDGDTLKVRLANSGKETDVRLIGIDTPETRRPGTPIECGGPQASTSMHQLADGRRVTLVTDPTQDRIDRYGRLLAYAIRTDGADLNKVQLRRGWAAVYVYNHNPFLRVKVFRRAQSLARGADRGVWGLCAGDFHTPQ